MRGLYKYCLTAGLIGVLGFGEYRVRSEAKKVREEQSQTENNTNRELLQISKRLDKVEDAVRRQLTLIGILEEYDINGNRVIDNEEWNRYSGDVEKVGRIFKKYDTDSTDLLNREELYRLLKDYLGKQGITKRKPIEKILNHVLKQYDRNRKDSLLNKVELIRLIHDYEEVFHYKF